MAVKALRLDLTPEQLREFVEELQRVVLLGLTHPSLVRLLDAGLEGTTAYLAEEYVAAESLDVALRHYAPAPLETVLPFIKQLGGAVDHAAAAGVRHGALHPRDIFLTPDSARAGGFGIAQALETVGLRPPVRRPYSAPERIGGDAWGSKADVFALAAIAYELLTAKRIAGAGDHFAASLEGEPNVTPATEEVLQAGLADDPSKRYPSALVFVAALEAARDDGLVAETTDTVSGAATVVSGGLAAENLDPAAAIEIQPEPVDRADLVLSVEYSQLEDEGDGGVADDEEDDVMEHDRSASPADDVRAEAAPEPLRLPIGPDPDASPETPPLEPVLSDDSGAVGEREPADGVSTDDVSDGDLSTDDVSDDDPVDDDLSHDDLPDDDESRAQDADGDEDSSAPTIEEPRSDLFVDGEAQVLEDAEPDVETDESLEVGTFDAFDEDESDDHDVSVAARASIAPDTSESDGSADEQHVDADSDDDVPYVAVTPARVPPSASWPPPPAVPRASSNWSSSALGAAGALGIVLGFIAGYLWSPPVVVEQAAGGNPSEPIVARELGPVAADEAPRVVAIPPTPVPMNAPPSAIEPRAGTSPRAEVVTPEPREAATSSSVGALPTRPQASTGPVTLGARDGRLLIRSTPAGAPVTIDDSRRGSTPLVVRDLEYGSYEVRVTSPGLEPQTRRLTVTRERPSAAVTFDLTVPVRESAAGVEATTGSLYIDSLPRGALVIFDGAPFGTTPLLAPGVAIGAHDVELTLDGYRRWTSSVQVRNGQRNRVTGSLEPQRP